MKHIALYVALALIVLRTGGVIYVLCVKDDRPSKRGASLACLALYLFACWGLW